MQISRYMIDLFPNLVSYLPSILENLSQGVIKDLRILRALTAARENLLSAPPIFSLLLGH